MRSGNPQGGRYEPSNIYCLRKVCDATELVEFGFVQRGTRRRISLGDQRLLELAK